MQYTIEDNRIVLVDSDNSIQILWFKDMNSGTISGTDIFFSMTWGNVMVNLLTITQYNGGSCIPPNGTIYNETQNAITSFNVDDKYCNPIRIISTRDPLPTDDITKGYVMFTQWLNETNHNLYQCSSNVAGAAVWDWLQYVYL